MKLKFSLFSLFATAAFYQAQSFVEQTTNFKDFYYSSSSLGDFNNDGLLDIAITGAIDSNEDGNVDTTVTYIYKNTNGKQTEHQILQAPVHLGDIKFIDIDNDGDLDIISVGLSYQDIVNYKSYVYINDNGNFVLDKSDVGKIYSSIELADFNHDGKMDYFINGVEYQAGVGFVFEMDYYKNEGGIFQKNKNFLPGTQNGSFKIADFNNDQHLDFIVSGLDKDYNPYMTLYLNDGQQLVEKQIFDPLSQSSFAIADFDGDGYQDIVAIGSNEEHDNVFRYYKNNRDGSFTQQDTNIEGVSNASGSKAIDAGDINKDGYPDIIISGDNNDNDAVTKIYTYNPTSKNFEIFEDDKIAQLGGVTNVQLADFNNDNNLDVFISGFDWDATNLPSVTKLYTNENNLINTKPTPPTILSHNIVGKKLSLEWSGATDDKTPVDGLMYEISLGKTNDKSDIAKYIVTTKKWFLEFEELPQDIYWSVKSIDAGNQYSNQSEIKKITNLSTNDSSVDVLNIYPNPVKSTLNIDSSKKIKSISVYDLSGKLIRTYSPSTQLDLSSLSKGTYILTIQFTNSHVVNKKIIKE